MPHPPQLSESDAVFTHSEPQAVSPVAQELPPPAPAAPVEPFPPLPGLLCVEVLLQAAARIARPSPKSHARAVLMTTRIPGPAKPDRPCKGR